jgi:hypothetical protein
VRGECVPPHDVQVIDVPSIFRLIHYESFRGVVYYESINREIQTRPTYECRCDDILKIKTEESTRLTYTGLSGGLEHLKIKTRLIDELFACVIGEYVF